MRYLNNQKKTKNSTHLSTKSRPITPKLIYIIVDFQLIQTRPTVRTMQSYMEAYFSGYSYVAALPYSKDLLCSRVKSLVVDFRHKFSQVTSSDAVWV